MSSLTLALDGFCGDGISHATDGYYGLDGFDLESLPAHLVATLVESNAGTDIDHMELKVTAQSRHANANTISPGSAQKFNRPAEFRMSRTPLITSTISADLIVEISITELNTESNTELDTEIDERTEEQE